MLEEKGEHDQLRPMDLLFRLNNKKLNNKEQQHHCFRCRSDKHLDNDKNGSVAKVKCDKCNNK